MSVARSLIDDTLRGMKAILRQRRGKQASAVSRLARAVRYEPFEDEPGSRKEPMKAEL